MLSIIIPSFQEPYLQNTIDSLLENAQGKIEILPILDGYTPPEPIKSDPRVRVIRLRKNKGMRGAINTGLKNAKGNFIMKCDAHCAFAPGFDKIMTKYCRPNWLMIPRRYPLDIENWTRRRQVSGIDHHRLTFPAPTRFGITLTVQVWYERKYLGKGANKDIDDTMTFQGSCWLANKKYFMEKVGFLDDRKETYGTFAGDQEEIGLKYWLGDGKIKIIKTTWYAHLAKQRHHYMTGMFSRTYKSATKNTSGYTWSSKHWMNNEEPGMKHPFSWLIKKFWPVPGWPEDEKLWVFPK